MTVRIDLPGANTFPTFRKKCRDCGYEFDFVGTYEESDRAVCPECSSIAIEELYMSFPDDGPGYQQDYGTQTDRLRGGSCGSGCGGS
mgnify:CR=1 FL=1